MRNLCEWPFVRCGVVYTKERERMRTIQLLTSRLYRLVSKTIRKIILVAIMPIEYAI